MYLYAFWYAFPQCLDFGLGLGDHLLMQISISGKNIDTGLAFQEHAKRSLNNVVEKYFQNAGITFIRETKYFFDSFENKNFSLSTKDLTKKLLLDF